MTHKVSLYPYQKEAADAAINSNVGQIILPTGTGKTKIQEAILESLMKNDSGFGVYVILTPRILLTNQLMKDVARHLAVKANIDIRTLTVHSDKPADLYDEKDPSSYDEVFAMINNEATTSTETIIARIDEAKITNLPLLVCSTYNSIPTLVRALEQTDTAVKQVLADEAHYIVEKTFHENVKSLIVHAERVHYFTATQKITDSDEGNGMNNVSVYGDVIYRKTPNDMVKAGYMVPPRIHQEIVTGDASWPQIVMDGFDHHEQEVHSSLNAKMLVCCDGIRTIEEISENPKFKNYCNTKGIKLFTVSSKTGAKIDGVDVKRNDFLAKLKSYTGKAIILHINILTEGISVPDISGVMFIRNMGLCRFLQSLGRATRVLPQDRKVEVSKRLKKWAWAIVVERDDKDKVANLKNMLHNMRKAGFEAVEEVLLAYDRGIDEKVDFDDPKEKVEKMKSKFSELFEIVHVVEEEEFAAEPYETKILKSLENLMTLCE